MLDKDKRRRLKNKKRRSTVENESESKTVKPSTRSKRGRLSHSEKINKRLRGIEKGVGNFDHSKSIFNVNIFATVPVEINGFLISKTRNTILFRHKKSSASKKMRTSIFPTKNVIYLFGEVGETSQLLIPRRKIIASYTGTMSYDKHNNVVITDNTTEEVVTLFDNPNFEYEIYSDEDAQRKTVRTKTRPKTSKRSEKFQIDESDQDEDL